MSERRRAAASSPVAVPRPPARRRGPRSRPATRPRVRARNAGRSREAIFSAAAAEFAAAGFAGASVDRIAERAGLNKAMIYYHFADKEALYREIICDLFHGMADRLDAIAAGPAGPPDPVARIDAAIDGLATLAAARPHFPAMMAREIAEGGVHLDEAMLGAMTRVFGGIIGLLSDVDVPRPHRRFNPALMYFTLVAPLIFFMASGPVRARLKRHLANGPEPLARAAAAMPDELSSMIAHHKLAVRLMLTAPESDIPAPADARPRHATPSPDAADSRRPQRPQAPIAAGRPRRHQVPAASRSGDPE